ncbi:MAG: hypothetical protein U0791_02660 [Gemmataceae bacterium]
MNCRHCGQPRPIHSRGLCRACYGDPDVKRLFPRLYGENRAKYARRGAGNTTGPRPLPEPTTAAPGSPAKLATLIERAERGFLLFHPADA